MFSSHSQDPFGFLNHLHTSLKSVDFHVWGVVGRPLWQESERLLAGTKGELIFFAAVVRAQGLQNTSWTVLDAFAVTLRLKVICMPGIQYLGTFSMLNPNVRRSEVLFQCAAAKWIETLATITYDARERSRSILRVQALFEPPWTWTRSYRDFAFSTAGKISTFLTTNCKWKSMNFIFQNYFPNSSYDQ